MPTDNITVCSYPRSGTTLMMKIVCAVSGYSLMTDDLRHYEDDLISLAGLQNEQGIARAANIMCDAENNLVAILTVADSQNRHIKRIAHPIPDNISDKLFNCTRRAHVTHTSPSGLIYNKYLSDFRYKIFVCRDFRDVFNSMAKYVTLYIKDQLLMERLGDYDRFQKFNYLNINRFNMIMNEWNEHIQAYLDHRDSFLMVKYEDLMAHPEATIKRIAGYLNCDINDNSVAEITSRYFNKELKNEHNKLFRHFSGSDKRVGEWADFFNDYLIKLTKQNAGQYLKALGYEQDDSWGKTVTVKDKEFLGSLNSVCAHYDANPQTPAQKIEKYVNDTATSLAGYRVAVYGFGGYSRRLMKRLKDKSDIVFIADDNTALHNTTSDGINILPFTSLIDRFEDFDVILIPAYPDNAESMRTKLTDSLFGSHRIVCTYDSIFDEFAD